MKSSNDRLKHSIRIKRRSNIYNTMIRFLSGFALGYICAKKPPSSADIETFGADLQRFFLELSKFTSGASK